MSLEKIQSEADIINKAVDKRKEHEKEKTYTELSEDTIEELDQYDKETGLPESISGLLNHNFPEQAEDYEAKLRALKESVIEEMENKETGIIKTPEDLNRVLRNEIKRISDDNFFNSVVFAIMLHDLESSLKREYGFLKRVEDRAKASQEKSQEKENGLDEYDRVKKKFNSELRKEEIEDESHQINKEQRLEYASQINELKKDIKGLEEIKTGDNEQAEAQGKLDEKKALLGKLINESVFMEVNSKRNGNALVLDQRLSDPYISAYSLERLGKNYFRFGNIAKVNEVIDKLEEKAGQENFSDAEQERIQNTINDLKKINSSYDKNIEYPDIDLEYWRAGAAQYKNFLKDTNNFDDQGCLPTDVGEIQAMFLGEKPALFNNDLAIKYKNDLKKYGFETIGPYTYNRESVERIIQFHHKEFEEFGATDVEQAIQKLNQSKITENHIMRGLILGYPDSSVVDLNQPEDINSKSRPFVSYGMAWKDRGTIKESIHLHSRHHAVFTQSGILDQ